MGSSSKRCPNNLLPRSSQLRGHGNLSAQAVGSTSSYAKVDKDFVRSQSRERLFYGRRPQYENNVMLMKEYMNFESETARMPKDAWKKRVAESLYKTVDGYGLRSFSNGIGISEWIGTAVPKMPSDQHIKCLKVRAASLQCGLRSARWGRKLCEIFESLRHMIQKCPRTEGPRHERHNNIVKILERELEGRGYSTNVEPRIPTNDGVKIPDLCAWKEEQYIVCNVAIAINTADIDLVNERKVAKYDMPDIHAWMSQNAIANIRKPNRIVTACVCKWRGSDGGKIVLHVEKSGFVEVVPDEHRDPSPLGHLQDLESPQIW